MSEMVKLLFDDSLNSPASFGVAMLSDPDDSSSLRCEEVTSAHKIGRAHV